MRQATEKVENLWSKSRRYSAESTRFRRGLKIGAESARLRRGKPQVSLLLACSGSFFRACFRLGARKLVGATCF